jgi:serine/threonine protein phosphatase PrpC
MNFAVSSTVRAGNPELQDRVEVFRWEHRVLIAVADGAGGISGGTQAAELFMQIVHASATSLTSADACRQLLNRIDRELAISPECGETTGVLVGVEASADVFGAGVGDSLVWAFSSNMRVELTQQQERKPLLGSGVSAARPFAQAAVETTIVVATDGLWKYTSLAAIEKCVRTAGALKLADQLCELVRLRSGDFPDDVAIVTCRVMP